jgi:hypothetical protein
MEKMRMGIPSDSRRRISELMKLSEMRGYPFKIIPRCGLPPFTRHTSFGIP